MGAGKIELLQEKSVLSQNPIKTENPCEFTFEFSHGTKEKTPDFRHFDRISSVFSSHFCENWRRVWDSNPRGREPKRFSRPPRYDRFDSLPCMLTLFRENFIFNFYDLKAPPRYVLLRCPTLSSQETCSPIVDRSHSLLLACSATGSARKRPRFDSLPCINALGAFSSAQS